MEVLSDGTGPRYRDRAEAGGRGGYQEALGGMYRDYSSPSFRDSFQVV